ncbi:MAG: valine--tRNA ligase [Oscillospiraceae bacterium]|jgi:valyl-tRNA synthetase|nr:valine--tRNA ligase [Oscillospiraceae bacterium]
MPKELAKQYEPAEAEERLYQWWSDSGFFRPSGDATKPPYTVMMPPPNITGQLHMGHAFPYTMQDILIRWRRMQGYDTLWLPGTDHAAIATEAKIVEAMALEGITKDDLGRERFLERAWQWNEKYGGRITEQLRKLGFSCDWERQRFTMDAGCNKAVNEVFCRLFEKGLIYRGERIINWCPHCLTSISDAEVDYEEKDGHFWHLRYPLADGSGSLLLATTRPETLLGDTAVAVHPEDERYKAFIGKEVVLPVVGRRIPVVADTYVEMDFGTGVVKITPAHDPNDFEVGLRHGLPVLNVMTDDGRMNENAGQYAGLDRYECRKQLVAELDKLGFLAKTEPMKHNVGSCYRCGTVVEPRVSLQWFVRMQPLAEPAIAAVRSGETRMVPERFTKTYFHWMENIKDWCISRQLWWGHRIPVWYCADCGEMTVARETPAGCAHCGGQNLAQDPDSLDTWFSSALWPFSTLGWPDATADLARYYPTSTLVTAYDILFFWVARMLFSGLEHTGQTPFSTVLFSGIVRDAQGRKMSKSLGNGIDPLEVIAQYGADALRFSLITGNSPGNDVRLSDEKVAASRNFANKLWNASRFIRMNLGEDEPAPHLPAQPEREDGWILSRLNRLTGEVTENLEKFELGIALQKIYDFLWDDFCDWYIELSKTRLQRGGQPSETARAVLVYTLERTLRLLHPFMPFVTEEIWQALPHTGVSLMLAPWPVFDPALEYPDEEKETEILLAAIRAVRSRRAEMNVPPGRKAKLHVESATPELFTAGEEFFRRLAGASAVEPVAGGFELDGAVTVVTADCRITIPLGELVDLEAEQARLRKELEGAEKQIASVQAKLGNASFLAKAPESVVAAQRETLRRAEEKAALLRISLAQ